MSTPTSQTTTDITDELRGLQNGWEEPGYVILLAKRAADIIARLRAEIAQAKRNAK